MNKIKVVVVGGGFGGCKTALELSNKEGVEVTLISDRKNFEYHGALYRSATGSSPTEVSLPLKEIFEHAKNVTLAQDYITGLDSKHKRVISDTGAMYDYDKLVIALGNIVNYYGIEGMEKHAHTINNVAGAIALRNDLTQCFKAKKLDPTIAIIGAGASGTELAGEIQVFARKVAEKYGVRVHHPHVVLVEGVERVLPALDPVLSAKAYKRLLKLGVEMKLSTRVNSCQPNKVCLDTGDLDATVMIWTAGTRIPDIFGNHPKHFQLKQAQVCVDDYMHAQNQKDIFVIGDNAFTKYSGMAQTALHDAKYVARSLLAQMHGKKVVKYRTRKPIYVVPVGPKWAVMDSDKSKISGYKAWVMRRRADRWIFKNFLPYKKAIKQWRKGNKTANF